MARSTRDDFTTTPTKKTNVSPTRRETTCAASAPISTTKTRRDFAFRWCPPVTSNQAKVNWPLASTVVASTWFVSTWLQ